MKRVSPHTTSHAAYVSESLAGSLATADCKCQQTNAPHHSLPAAISALRRLQTLHSGTNTLRLCLGTQGRFTMRLPSFRCQMIRSMDWPCFAAFAKGEKGVTCPSRSVLQNQCRLITIHVEFCINTRLVCYALLGQFDILHDSLAFCASPSSSTHVVLRICPSGFSITTKPILIVEGQSFIDHGPT